MYEKLAYNDKHTLLKQFLIALEIFNFDAENRPWNYEKSDKSASELEIKINQRLKTHDDLKLMLWAIVEGGWTCKLWHLVDSYYYTEPHDGARVVWSWRHWRQDEPIEIEPWALKLSDRERLMRCAVKHGDEKVILKDAKDLYGEKEQRDESDQSRHRKD